MSDGTLYVWFPDAPVLEEAHDAARAVGHRPSLTASVETPQELQRARARARGADFVQGFLIAKPGPRPRAAQLS